MTLSPLPPHPTLPLSARLLQELASILGVVLGGAIIAMILYCGYRIGVDSTRKSAVKAGVAEWIILDDSGKSGFHWKSHQSSSVTIPLLFEDFEAAE